MLKPALIKDTVAMFENLSLPHLLMVLAVAILVFGPKRIPEIAGSMGKGIREFKKQISEATRPENPPETLPQSTINDRGPMSSTEVSRASLPESGERGEPKLLLD
jgi:TatA/E family protein of Tat protein translocase